MNVSPDSAIHQTLNGYDFYRDAPSSLQEDIANHAISIRLKPGRYFYNTGEFCRQVMLIGDGTMRVGLASDKGREVTLYHVHAGECCALHLLCSLFETHIPATTYVDSFMRGVAIPTSVFQSWLETHDDIRQHVMVVLANRLSDIMRAMQAFAFHRLDQRLASLLLSHYENTNEQSPVVTITHQQIALELGSVREVISRTLSEFENDGIVALGRGKITLLDHDRLRSISVDKLN
ncbi:MAG: Crp/Fnr family transcriptional regulator [Gammaproteobacteria bacterium]|nr:Crp/Fnr family transcriptional regulator [Gammaproteobacteria bacterium]